jgi:hypothetical protein
MSPLKQHQNANLKCGQLNGRPAGRQQDRLPDRVGLKGIANLRGVDGHEGQPGSASDPQVEVAIERQRLCQIPAGSRQHLWLDNDSQSLGGRTQ